MALSAIVEVTQVVLPGRVPDADDVVANSIGTAACATSTS
ncbi:MAG: VanZ family protein [Agromyces sp.]